jgi:predicted transport protein
VADIKLFCVANNQVSPLVGGTDTIEKSVQILFEINLEALIGVRLVASEFTTTHGGRIDSLGLDENGSPVIIEYKRSTNENVINQGLFYLDWLMDHKKDFQWLVLKKFGNDAADNVDWSAPRLICVAGDYTRYDDHAVKQIQRNIELIRYRRFGSDLLMLDLASATTAGIGAVKTISAANGTIVERKTIEAIISELDDDLASRFEALRNYLLALGDDVQETTLRTYIAFKRIKNFACVELRPKHGTILVFVKVDPADVTLEPDFTRDVSDIGHWETGDLEITLSRAEDLERAKTLLQRSYDIS